MKYDTNCVLRSEIIRQTEMFLSKKRWTACLPKFVLYSNKTIKFLDFFNPIFSLSCWIFPKGAVAHM